MTPVEERIRTAFGAITVSAPPPAFDVVRRRARRIRTARYVAGAAAAVVVVGVIGIGLSAGLNSRSTDFAEGVTAVRTHIPGIDADPQWRVADQVTAGHRVVAASYENNGEVCVGYLSYESWCGKPRDVADGDVVRYDARAIDGVLRVVGATAPDARRVVVIAHGRKFVVPAVRTPTSDDVRFFAVFLPATRADAQTDGVHVAAGALDAVGRPLRTAPPPAADRVDGRSFGLPAEAFRIGQTNGGAEVLAYHDARGAVCVATVTASAVVARGCDRTTAGQPARVLASRRVDAQTRLLLGSAPVTVAQVVEQGGQPLVSATTAVPSLGRSFWVMEVFTPDLHRPGGVALVECVAPGDCVGVAPL